MACFLRQLFLTTMILGAFRYVTMRSTSIQICSGMMMISRMLPAQEHICRLPTSKWVVLVRQNRSVIVLVKDPLGQKAQHIQWEERWTEQTSHRTTENGRSSILLAVHRWDGTWSL